MDPRKSFLDKAVQTDLSAITLSTSPPRASYTFSHPDSPSYLQALDFSQSSDTSSAYRSLTRFGAYTYSDISFFDESRYLSDRPATNSSRPAKYGPLAFNKPAGSLSVNNRIVSLPETSPPCRIAREKTVRVVSMPEHLKALHHSAGFPEDYLDHSEYPSTPLDGELDTRESLANCTLYPSSPETSFPPSSPESVMIIGNDTQVHPTFLRPKSSIEDEERNGGWVPVSGSPPKPIPALHGPLSLPYARCPSGAEGTVVEGEDLTHMIWGLDSNGLQAMPTKPTPIFAQKSFRPVTSSQHKPISYQDDIGYPLRDQDIIDISRPEFHTSLPKSFVSMPHQNQRSRSYQNAFEDSLKDDGERKVGIYEFVRRDSPIQLYPSTLSLSQSEAGAWTTGLGIDLWQCAHENGSVSLSESVFSRADKGASQALLGSNRHFETNSGTRYTYSTPLGFSVYDTQTSGGQAQRSGILTPPDTGSPQWSPRFRQSHPVFISPDTHLGNREGYVGASISRTPEELSAFCREQETAYFIVDNGQGDETHLRSVSSESVDINSTASPEATRRFSTAQAVLSASKNQTYPIHRSTTPLSPVSPDLRRNLSQQQPRSIPLTRLIQRRLSSVAEEEYEPENVTPSGADKFLLIPPPTSVATRQQAPKETTPVQSQRARLSSDNRKQGNKLPIRVSRNSSGNAPNASTETNKPTDRTNATTEKQNTKSKKSYRKKKHLKKQTASEIKV